MTTESEKWFCSMFPLRLKVNFQLETVNCKKLKTLFAPESGSKVDLRLGLCTVNVLSFNSYSFFFKERYLVLFVWLSQIQLRPRPELKLRG